MMQRRKYLAVVLAACLVLSGCAGRETASVSSTGGEQVSSSLSSSQLQQPQEPEQQTPSGASVEGIKDKETAQGVLLSVKQIGAGFDVYGNLQTDPFFVDVNVFSDAVEEAELVWNVLSGYSLTDVSGSKGQISAGIQDASGNIAADYFYLIEMSDGDLIEYMNSQPELRLDLFHGVLETERYAAYYAAYPNDGDGWQKNNISSTDYGYELAIDVRLAKGLFLSFSYYFCDTKRVDIFADIPEHNKKELCSLIDSFSLPEPRGSTETFSSSTENFVNTSQNDGEQTAGEHLLQLTVPVNGIDEEQSKILGLTCPVSWTASFVKIYRNGKEMVYMGCRTPNQMENQLSSIDGLEQVDIGGRTFQRYAEEYRIQDFEPLKQMVPYIIWNYYFFDGEFYYYFIFHQNHQDVPVSLETFERVLATLEIREG